MESSNIIAMVVAVLAFLGQAGALWKALTSKIEEVDKKRAHDKELMAKKIEAEKDKNATQEAEIRLLKQASKMSQDMVVGKIEDLEKKVDLGTRKIGNLSDKLEHHMQTEGPALRVLFTSVIREELNNWKRSGS